MILGLSHITLVVKDLEQATLFFERIFGATQVYSSGNKTFSLSKERFFLISGLWVCIMEGEPLAEHTYNHIAFEINGNEIGEYLSKIKEVGVEIRPERPRIDGEGRSIYFYDFDNHLFELHAGSLDERLTSYSSDNHTV